MGFVVDWAYQYVFWRGLVAIVCTDVVATLVAACAREEAVAYVGMRFDSLRRAMRKFHRMMHYDRLARRAQPRLLLECTYAPGLATGPGPAVRIEGAVTDRDREVVRDLIGTFQAARRKPRSAFIKLISLKAHFAYDHVFRKLYDLTRERGGFFVATVTNDASYRGHLVCIGLEEEMLDRVLGIVANVPFHVIVQ